MQSLNPHKFPEKNTGEFFLILSSEQQNLLNDTKNSVEKKLVKKSNFV